MKTKLIKPTTLTQTLVGLMEKHHNDQTITLGEVIRRSGQPAQDVIDFLKNSKQGDFIAGRRGHPSRFVFGDAQEKWEHSEEIRREWRIRNGRNPLTGTLIRSRPDNGRRSHVNLGSSNRGRPIRGSLQVTVGDETVKVPLKLELV